MKIAVNKCYGGFGLSEEAYEELIAKGWTVTILNEEGNCVDTNARIVVARDDVLFGRYFFVRDRSDMEIRTDPDIIEVVERLGTKASGRFGNVVIVEVPDDADVTIEDYDGFEHVAEVHRTW
ncbi:hypothetical protein J2T13_000216 [Paenibacillus sp. DS2015]|uniref:hypothetical protein n=1 Tax=Paenibacillus sp. DS2015 TaxID=3373917 RepID=UPI003D213BF1